VGGFGRLPAHTVARLTEAVQSGFYFPIGGPRRLRLAARLVVGADTPSTGRADWPESLRAFWQALRVELPALRQHPGDIPFHLDFMARSLRLHKPVAATASAEDLATLQSLPLPGNFNDLRLYLIQGLRSLERSAGQPAGAEPEWDRLADMSKMQFDDYVLRRYLQGVMKRHGRNFEAWQEHTGYSRSTIFGWWKYLGEE
jgi:DNA-binding NtrC family response regulator